MRASTTTGWWAARAAVVFLCWVLAPATSNAEPTDCIGSAPDGLVKCTAPVVSGFSYSLCRSSSLYVEEAKAQACLKSGGATWTNESGLGAFIACMEGSGAISWKSSGGGNGFYCSVPPVTFKYGQEIYGVGAEINYPYGHLQPVRWKTVTCPPGTTPAGGSAQLPDQCAPVPPPPCCHANTPNPMGIASGSHGLVELDIPAAPGSLLEFKRHYLSSAYYRPVNASVPPIGLFGLLAKANPAWMLFPGFGDHWRHSYDRRILAENSPYLMATALRPNGLSKQFRADGRSVLNEDGRADSLVPILNAQGQRTGWRYTSAEGFETYDASGQLLRIDTRSGRWLTLRYSIGSLDMPAGLLLQVDDDSGRFLKLDYDDIRWRLVSVTDSAGKVVRYAYGSNEAPLSTVTLPDGGTRGYRYANNPMGRNGDAWGLTAVLDASGQTVASYGYAANGNAYSERQGGAAHYERVVTDATHVSLADPTGNSRSYTLQTVGGVQRVVGMSQPGWFGGGGSFASRSYDSSGTVASEDDFNGHRSCMQHDPVRLLETQRVEGLANTVACSSVNASGALLPAGSRKTSRQWHPDWPLPVRSASPGRLTTWVYNGQPDPTNGDVVATCAPANALLPNGKPIAVLCARVEQATLDADGSKGFAAALDTATPARRWTYTYNARGQELTETDPVGHVTTHSYYEAATTTAAVGDLQRITNAAGHATTFDSYDKNGLLLKKTEPTGLSTTITYDSRRRPLTVSTSAGGVTQATTHTYNTDGDLTRVQQPDGSVVQLNYDAGHRLVGWSDSDGNSVTYTLDNAGNRIAEQWKDPGGTLARNVSRVFDTLNRVQAVAGADE